MIQYNNIRMFTRSMTAKHMFSVNIDFDGSSRAWRANKRSLGNGCYEYKTPTKSISHDNTAQKTSVRTRQQARNSSVSTTRSGMVYKSA
jgi:hypothetical protein